MRAQIQSLLKYAFFSNVYLLIPTVEIRARAILDPNGRTSEEMNPTPTPTLTPAPASYNQGQHQSEEEVTNVSNVFNNHSLLVASALLFALAIRAAVSLHPYSGENTPPMYGDYEAQRHWMEITFNLAPSEWYVNTPSNNLTYWGLDYPPLSAYVSRLFASYVHSIDPQAVALLSSHGYETEKSRVTMRSTVWLSDTFLLFPVLFFVIRFLTPGDKRSFYKTLFFCLTLPSLILIDHAHFQYNGISASLFLSSMLALMKQYDSFAACTFCLCVYFKQMNLYYSLPIACTYISRLFYKLKHKGIVQATSYALRILLVIFFTTIVIFFPWLSLSSSSSSDGLVQIIRRLFPVSRGLYEDKVANVWCTLSSILPRRFRPITLINSYNLEIISICTVLTLVACLPFCIAVIQKPYSPTRILLSTAGGALSFFLFSFQVHEKQILLPLIPLSVLLFRLPAVCVWMSFVASMSIFPLLHKERSTFAYFGMVGLHAAIVAINKSQSQSQSRKDHIQEKPRSRRQHFAQLFTNANVCMSVMLHLVIMVVEPGTRWPDLFVVGTSSFCCVHFCAIYIVLIYSTFTL